MFFFVILRLIIRRDYQAPSNILTLSGDVKEIQYARASKYMQKLEVFFKSHIHFS